MKTLAVLVLVSGVLIVLVSLPLIYRKVPMNALWGIRIRPAFESEERWYAINAYGGRQLARWAGLIIAAGVAGLFLPPDRLPIYAIASTIVITLATVAPIIQILLWVRHLDSRGGGPPAKS
jgi:hypothetical protein